MGLPFSRTGTFKQLWKHQKKSCFFCGLALSEGPYLKKVNPFGHTRDHFLPKSAGHCNKGNNVIACMLCNRDKSSEPPSYRDCIRFVELWSKVKHTSPLSPIWDEFIEDLKFIRRFSQLFGLPDPIIERFM